MFDLLKDVWPGERKVSSGRLTKSGTYMSLNYLSCVCLILWLLKWMSITILLLILPGPCFFLSRSGRLNQSFDACWSLCGRLWSFRRDFPQSGGVTEWPGCDLRYLVSLQVDSFQSENAMCIDLHSIWSIPPVVTVVSPFFGQNFFDILTVWSRVGHIQG